MNSANANGKHYGNIGFGRPILSSPCKAFRTLILGQRASSFVPTTAREDCPRRQLLTTAELVPF